MFCISLNVPNLNYGRIANHIQILYYHVNNFKVVMENVLNKILKIELPWSTSHTCKPLIYKGKSKLTLQQFTHVNRYKRIFYFHSYNFTTVYTCKPL